MGSQMKNKFSNELHFPMDSTFGRSGRHLSAKYFHSFRDVHCQLN